MVLKTHSPLPPRHTDRLCFPPSFTAGDSIQEVAFFPLQNPLGGCMYHQLPFGYDTIVVKTTVHWKNLS